VSKEIWNILKLINWTKSYFENKSIESARLEAEILLAHVLQCKRIDLYTSFSRILTEDELSRFRELVKRRAAGCPVQYITGKTDFFSTELAVREGVLIPRPETEVLVDEAIKILAASAQRRDSERLLLDLGTGSGNIPVAILKHVPMLKVYATDISDAAIDLAAENAAKYAFSKYITFLCGGLFEPLTGLNLEGKFDMIVSNPPYVSPEEYETLSPTVRDFEPPEALVAQDGGLFFHKKIIESADKYLRPKAFLLIECGATQAPALQSILREAGTYDSIEAMKDYSGILRVVKARRSTG